MDAFKEKATVMTSAALTNVANSEAVKVAKEKMEAAKAAAQEKFNEGLGKVGVKPEDLEKLEKIPLVVGCLGVFTFFVLMSTQFSVSWAKGIALYEGEPVEVYASLGSVMFGTEGMYTEKISSRAKLNCPPGNHCPLDLLAGDCIDSMTADKFDLSGMPTTTPKSKWCMLRDAGRSTQALAGIGDVIAFVAPIATLIFAAKEIECVGKIFLKIEQIGFTKLYQQIIVGASWLTLWGFLLFAMLDYAYAIPDTLGVGVLEFEFSFGMLRLCFLLVSVLTAALVVHFAQVYSAENTAEAWTEFVDTKCCSAKKMLYLLLLSQLVLYLLLGIYAIRWEMLLVFFCFYYVDAKKDNFKLIYVILTLVTILLDVIEILAIPTDELMSKGQAFSRSVFVLIFFTKFLVLGTMYLYSKEEQAGVHNTFTRLEEGGASDGYSPAYDQAKMEDEIAE